MVNKVAQSRWKKVGGDVVNGTLACSTSTDQTVINTFFKISITYLYLSISPEIFLQLGFLRHQISAELKHMSETPALHWIIGYLKLGFQRLDRLM